MRGETLTLLFLLGCSRVETNLPCAPGEQRSCSCPDGFGAVQVCDAEGTAFGACACGTGTANSATSSNTGSGADGGGGSGPCTPGEVVACYTGPSGTQDVGICQAGTATCQPDGTPGTCDGEVVPGSEDCQTPEDENCDGATPACEPPWSLSFTTNADYAPGFLATDSAGNVYLAGTFTGSLDFGGGPLNAVGTADIFVAKFTGAGAPVWSKAFGEPLDPLFLTGMDVDINGNIALAGIFYEQLDLGGGMLSTDTSAAFVAMLDTDGDHVWSAAAEGNVSWALPIAFDVQGNVTYGALFSGSIFFGGADVHMGSGTAFARFSNTGTFLASEGYADCSPNSTPVGLDVAPNGDIRFMVRAPYNGGCDWGGGPVPPGPGIGVAGLGSDFSASYSDVFSGVNIDAPYSVASGPNGEVALTVTSGGPVNFAGTVVDSGSTAQTGLLAVLEPTGELRYGKYFEGVANSAGTRLARPQFTAATGEVAVHGSMFAASVIGGSTLTPIGTRDSLLIQLSPTGAVTGSNQYGAPGVETEGWTMAMASGGLILAGRYSGGPGGPDFGQGPLPGAGEFRGFLALVQL